MKTRVAGWKGTREGEKNDWLGDWEETSGQKVNAEKSRLSQDGGIKSGQSCTRTGGRKGNVRSRRHGRMSSGAHPKAHRCRFSGIGGRCNGAYLTPGQTSRRETRRERSPEGGERKRGLNHLRRLALWKALIVRGAGTAKIGRAEEIEAGNGNGEGILCGSCEEGGHRMADISDEKEIYP